MRTWADGRAVVVNALAVWAGGCVSPILLVDPFLVRPILAFPSFLSSHTALLPLLNYFSIFLPPWPTIKAGAHTGTVYCSRYIYSSSTPHPSFVPPVSSPDERINGSLRTTLVGKQARSPSQHLTGLPFASNSLEFASRLHSATGDNWPKVTLVSSFLLLSLRGLLFQLLVPANR